MLAVNFQHVLYFAHVNSTIEVKGTDFLLSFLYVYLYN